MAPGPAAAPDADSLRRTLEHMNKDHREDLSLYLRHFAGLSAKEAGEDPEMTGMDLRSMTIRAGAGRRRRPFSVPLSPPLASWGERRLRLVEMSAKARAALGLPPPPPPPSSAVIAEFRPPRGFDLVVFAGVLLYFCCFALVRAGGVSDPQQPAWRALEAARVLPPQAFRRLVDALFVPVMAIHLGELWWLDRTRLAPAGVRRGTRVWCLWMGSCFFEGLRAFRRFDALRLEKTALAEKLR